MNPNIGITVFTRFSLWHKGSIPTQEWIESRFALLKKITLPSLNQQSYEKFVWLIASSPQWYERTCALFDGINARQGIEIKVSTLPVPAHILSSIHVDATRFVTVRLDSDDALQRDAIFRISVQSVVVPDGYLLNMPFGYKLDWNTRKVLCCKYHDTYQGPFFCRCSRCA
jgi:hypothetical protein